MEIDVWAPSVLHSPGCSPLSRLLKNATIAEEASHLRVTYWPFSSLRPCTVKGSDRLCGFTWKKNSPGSGTCPPCLQVNKRGPVSSHPPADLGPSLWAIATRVRGAQGTQCPSSGWGWEPLCRWAHTHQSLPGTPGLGPFPWIETK